MIQLYIYIDISSFQILFSYRLLQDTEYSSQCHAVGPCCLPTLYSVVLSHLVVSDSL